MTSIEKDILELDARRVNAIRMHNSCSDDPHLRDIIWAYVGMIERHMVMLIKCNKEPQ